MPTGVYKRTEDHKRKIKESWKKRRPPFITDAGRQRLRELHVGENNPMYGKPAWNTGKHIRNNDALRIWRQNGGVNWNKGKHGLQVAWNKGLSAGENEKIARSTAAAHAAIRGKPAWNRGKPNTWSSGSRSNLWRGGKWKLNGTLRQQDMGTLEYKNWRRAVFERDQYTCQMCYTTGKPLQADHIFPYAAFPEQRYDVLNGRTLCEACHRRTPTWGNRCTFIQEGRWS